MSKTKEGKFVKMVNDAARNASKALTKLSGEKINVEVSRAEVTRINRKFPDMKPETIVAGIHLPVTGDIKGAALLIFPEKIAYKLCDVLMKRKPGTTRKFTELDKSALKEVGNIICGSFLTVLSNALKVKMIEHIPEFSFDMFGAVVDVIITRFAQGAEDALVIEVKFVFEHVKINGYVFFVFGLEQMNAIIKALEIRGAAG